MSSESKRKSLGPGAEEKQKQHQGSQKAEREASEIQQQLKQLEDAVGAKNGMNHRTIN